MLSMQWLTNLACLKFWNSFWLEIIIYQADIFIQTHKTTAANLHIQT